MNHLRKICFTVPSIVGLMMCCCLRSQAQEKSIDTSKAKSLTGAGAVSAIKPYKDVVPASAKTMKSFITVHVVADRFLFEIPDSMMKQDILIVSRIDRSPEGFVMPLVNIGYAGDEVGKAVIAFEKIPGDKIALRSLVFEELANDTTPNGLSRALSGSTYQSILGTFPVKAVHKETNSTVIDVTDFINGDNGVVSFGIPFIRNFLANLIADRSYIDNVLAFPEIGRASCRERVFALV